MDTPPAPQWKQPAIYGLLWAGTLSLAYHWGIHRAPAPAPSGSAAAAADGIAQPRAAKFGSAAPDAKQAQQDEEDGRLTLETDTLADLNPEEEFNALMTQPASPARNRALVRLFARWAELDGKNALLKSQTIAEPLLRYEAREAALRHWGMVQPAEAWAHAEADRGLTLPDDRFSAILRGLGKSDPATALAFFQNHKDGAILENIGDAVNAFDTLYQRGGHAQMVAWTESLPAGKLREGAMNRIIDQWARYDPKLAKQWMEKMLPANPAAIGPARVELAESWARVNPQQALDWVGSLPAKEQDGVYYDRIFRRWLDLDRDAAAAQLANLPPSPALDRSIERYSYEIASRDPAATMPWAASITDEKRRWRAIERVAGYWRKKDPQGLANFVQTGGFNADQQKALLRVQ
jgi:hypothetical protein